MAKNKKIIENFVADPSTTAESRERLSTVDLSDGLAVAQVVKDYPTLKNEFIKTLQSKIVQSKLYSKIYENPYRMFHKGHIPAGIGIEQMFLELASSKGFFDHFEGNDEADLIRAEANTVLTNYITRNFMLKYKSSISDQRLKDAFTTPEGLTGLANQIVSRNASSAQVEEKEMFEMLLESAASLKALEQEATGSIKLGTNAIPADVATAPMAREALGELTNENRQDFTKRLIEKVIELASEMSFPSTAYNMAGVKTWTEKQNLVLCVSPKVKALIDVEVLAFAFNQQHADMAIRVVEVQKMPKSYATKAGVIANDESNETYAMLMDADFIQLWETLVDSSNFYNPATLVTNMFYHRHGIASNCFFANCVALTKN